MDDNKGFIKLDRKLLEWAWHDDPSTFALWIHILLMANYENKKWHEFEVPAGSFITSVQHLAESVNLSRNTIYKSLNKLEQTGEITRVSRHRANTQIYVNNWAKFQGNVKGNVNSNVKGNVQKMNIGMNTGMNIGVDITKEIKKERNKEVKNTSTTEDRSKIIEALYYKTPEEIERGKRVAEYLKKQEEQKC